MSMFGRRILASRGSELMSHAALEQGVGIDRHASQVHCAASGPLDLGRQTDRPIEYYELKREIVDTLLEVVDVSRLAHLEKEAARREIRTAVDDISRERRFALSAPEHEQVVQDVCDDVLGYGPLEPLLARDDIADIMVNGDKPIFVEIDGKVVRTNLSFRDQGQLLNVCQRIASQAGRRVDESSPICDARLPDGSRVNVVVPPLAIDGASLTIRKFRKQKRTMAELVQSGGISPEAAEVLRIMSRSRCNILISGGTGSGKTTLLNCMTSFIDPGERVVTCEDVAELQLQQPHVVRLETRPANLEGKGEVSMRNLVRNCLRMRPDRIIVGEVRGSEALDLLQAMNTGHDGSMGTLHANNPREALSRLESLVAMGGFSLPPKTIREIVCASIDVVIQVARLRDGSRRVTHITEVVGMEGDVPITQDLFTYEVSGTDPDDRVIGRHKFSGIGRPRFWPRAQYFGEDRHLAAALGAATDRAH